MASSTALAIGVAMAPRFERRGESLADARAYEAAGCDSLWLDGEEDPWLCAAALAVATTRVRLVVPATPADVAAGPAFARRVATLHRLLSGRLAVLATTATVGPLRAALEIPVFCEVDRLADAPDEADGLVLPAEAVLGGETPPLPATVWLRCAGPLDRSAFRELRERCRRSGAAGAVVRETPRLLDQLRNPDQDDDRADLSLAHG